MTDASLVARDITVRLSGREALKAASFAIVPGEVVAVAGPNGAGKSTLLRALAGLVAPVRGEVMLDGRPLNAFARREIAVRIAYLPQDRTIHWPVSVETVVGLGRLPHRGLASAPSALDHDAVVRAMSVMDVAHFAQRPVTELSGGERARVLIARALAQGANFLLADEPASGLDPGHALSLFSHLRALARSGHAIAVALHDLSFAARFADRLVLLKEGEILANGPVRDVLTGPQLAASYGVVMRVGEICGIPVVLADRPGS